MNILLIEDNLQIIKGLIYSFSKTSYNLVYKRKISESKLYIENSNVDLIILDITLPDGNGFDFYKNYIKIKKIPTIFLTACDIEEMVVSTLELGAEDYMTKPFSAKELLVRINKILLRNKKNKIKVKDITFDLDKLVLYKENKEIILTPIELNIINLLFTNINKVVTRNTILDKIWQCSGNYVEEHTVTVYFKRIREKIRTDIIKTIKGIGYRIDEE